MVTEINKLICGALLAHRAVVIPGVGTLCVVHHGARRLSRRRIAAPYNEVEFRSNETGTSLVDLIREAAVCDDVQARAIFDRWLAKSRDGEVLTLEGIGILRHRAFIPEKAFAERLNPLGNEVVTLQPRMNRLVVATAVVAVVIAAGVFGYILMKPDFEFDRIMRAGVEQTPAVTAQGAASPSPTTVSPSERDTGSAELQGAESGRPAGEDSLRRNSPVVQGTARSLEGGSTPASAASETVAAASDKSVGSGAAKTDADSRKTAPEGVGQTSSTVTVPAERMQSGWSYVVYGVFSTEANAARCRDELLRTNPSMAVAAYPFGSKYMVTPYGSQTRGECERFAREHREQWPDLWIYSKK